MEKLLGNLPEGVDKDQYMAQANNIWQMLDDMSANNPAAYKTFIDKQMKERKEYMSPPNAHMCVHTVVKVSDQ